MKKKIAAIAMSLVTAVAIGIGVCVPAFAYSTAATITATNSNGEAVEATFTLEGRYDSDTFDMVDQFWAMTGDQQKAVMTYYGYDQIATSLYAAGTLDLSQSGASAENPVTITFSMTAEYGAGVEAGCKYLYVLQKLEDGTWKLINAQSTATGTATAQFTDAVSSKIIVIELAIALESLDPELSAAGYAAPDVEGIQSATDAQGNPVNVTVAPLDRAIKAIASEQAYVECNGATPFAATDVNLEGTSVSADNPITVTFSVAGVNAGETITVLHKKADGTWEILPGTAGTGTVTATFTSFSPVIFVRAAAADAASNTAAAEPKKDKVPNTGETDRTMLWLTLAVLSGAGMVCQYRRKKAVMK